MGDKDRSWMYGKRTTYEYIQGVLNFMKYAEENKSKKGEDFLVCPCCDCKNLRRFRSSEQVKTHLIRRGFKQGYDRWIWHGESTLPSTSAGGNKMNNDDLLTGANRMTEEFKEKSKKAKEKQEHNVGYAGKTPLVADPIPSQSSCSSISSTVAPSDRGLDRIQAKSKKGYGNYYIPDEKITAVVQKICEEVSQGSFKPNKQPDVLLAALDKEEHPGSVRGGVGVTVKEVFEKPEKSRGDEARELIMKELNEKTRQEIMSKLQPLKDQLHYLMKRLPQQFPADLRALAGTPQSVYKPVAHSSCQSVDPYPFVQIEEDIVMKSKSQNTRNEKNYEHGEASSTRVRPHLVDDDILQRLGAECNQLHSLLRKMHVDTDYFELELDHNIFHHTNMKSIFVMMNDIKGLLTMQLLDVSIIQVFIMYLHRLCNQFGVDSVGFLCPTQIVQANVDLNISAVITYIGNTMFKLKDKTLILAPYHKSQHWLLLVINVCSGIVYVFDPMNCDRVLDLKPIVNMAFRIYTHQQGQRATKKVEWKNVKCPQSSGSVECGYYVMKYMHEICTKYSTFTSLDKVFQDNTMAYSIEEIDEMREMWAKYFINECI